MHASIHHRSARIAGRADVGSAARIAGLTLSAWTAWVPHLARTLRLALVACATLLLLPGCSRHDDELTVTRSYAMGFSWFPPRPELPLPLLAVEGG